MDANKVLVELPDNSYPILIKPSLLNDLAFWPNLEKYDQIAVFSQLNLFSLYAERLIEKLKLNNNCILMPPIDDGEDSKCMSTFEKMLTQLLEIKATRNTLIIALGGGVVGDLTGFVSACYLRGVDYIQIPTTLLAQVDSSVGGKTAINHPLGKNLIGAFYQPAAVIVDPNTLMSLPSNEFQAGLAEVLKYGFIADRQFFEYLMMNGDRIQPSNLDVMNYIIERCCQIKANIVKQDEKDNSIRALLNFGHTFGHAIETFTHYKVYLHGEAVALGMQIAINLSWLEGFISKSQYEIMHSAFERMNLKYKLPGDMDLSDFLAAMKLDKKVKNNEIYLILLKGVGEAFEAPLQQINIENLKKSLEMLTE